MSTQTQETLWQMPHIRDLLLYDVSAPQNNSFHFPSNTHVQKVYMSNPSNSSNASANRVNSATGENIDLRNKKIISRNNWNNMLQVEIVPFSSPVPRYGVSRVVDQYRTNEEVCPLRKAIAREIAAFKVKTAFTDTALKSETTAKVVAGNGR